MLSRDLKKKKKRQEIFVFPTPRPSILLQQKNLNDVLEILLGTKYLCAPPLQIHMSKSNPHRDALWKWRLWEVLRS